MLLFPLQWATLRMERGAKEKNHQLYKPYTNGKTGPPGAPLTSTPPLLPAAGREYALLHHKGRELGTHTSLRQVPMGSMGRGLEKGPQDGSIYVAKNGCLA